MRRPKLEIYFLQKKRKVGAGLRAVILGVQLSSTPLRRDRGCLRPLLKGRIMDQSGTVSMEGTMIRGA
jgi:hypothetical protein